MAQACKFLLLAIIANVLVFTTLNTSMASVSTFPDARDSAFADVIGTLLNAGDKGDIIENGYDRIRAFPIRLSVSFDSGRWSFAFPNFEHHRAFPELVTVNGIRLKEVISRGRVMVWGRQRAYILSVLKVLKASAEGETLLARTAEGQVELPRISSIGIDNLAGMYAARIPGRFALETISISDVKTCEGVFRSR